MCLYEHVGDQSPAHVPRFMVAEFRNGDELGPKILLSQNRVARVGPPRLRGIHHELCLSLDRWQALQPSLHKGGKI